MICVKRFLAVLLSLFIFAGVPAATGIFLCMQKNKVKKSG